MMMTVATRRSLTQSIPLMASLLAASCDTPGDDSSKPAAATQSELNGVNGDLLHVIKVRDDHRIEFYKLKDGQNGIFESFPMDRGSVMENVSDTKSLAAVFRALRPHEPMPAALLSADKLAADMLAEGKVSQLEPEAPARATAPSATENHVNFAIRGESICSGDNLSDNWGADWFRDNSCSRGGGNFQHCFTNIQRTARYAKGWFKWIQFTGDFKNNPGRMETWHYACPFLGAACELVRDISWIVNPRFGAEFTYTTSGGHGGRGTSNCAHTHLFNGSGSDSYEIDINQGGLPHW